jgi:hypothetical protein
MRFFWHRAELRQLANCRLCRRFRTECFGSGVQSTGDAVRLDCQNGCGSRADFFGVGGTFLGWSRPFFMPQKSQKSRVATAVLAGPFIERTNTLK